MKRILINFSDIERDESGGVRPPVMVLRTLHGGIKGVIGAYFNLSLELKFNETSTASFDVPAYDGVIPTPFYGDIAPFKTIDIKPYGIFVVSEATVSGDGLLEVKTCSCVSLETVLSHANIVLGAGTYNLYNAADMVADTPGTIMGIVRSLAPDWSVDVADSLIGRWRTFDETDENMLDWLMNTAQKSYGCIFTFDTYNRVIKVLDASLDYAVAPIFLSYGNLIKEIEVRESTDNLFTVLSVHGAEPVNIYEVNPTGVNKIYNLDYFIGTGDIEASIANKWAAWRQEIASKQPYFTALQLLYGGAVSALTAHLAALTELEYEMAGINNQIDVTTQALALQPGSSSLQSQYQTYIAAREAKAAQLAAKRAEITATEQSVESYADSIAAVSLALKMENWFTSGDMAVLRRYFIEDSFVDETFAVFDTDAAGSGSELFSSTRCSVSVTAYTAGDITELDMSAIDPQNIIGKRIVRFSGGRVSIRDTGASAFSLDAEIIYGTAERRNSGGAALCTIYAGAGSVTDSSGTRSFLNGNVTLTGASSSFGSSGAELVFNTCNFFFTRNATGFESYAVQQQLYDYATRQHGDIAYPECSFEVESGNIVFAREFKPFCDELALGSGVYLDLGNGAVLKPLLLEIHIDFESPDNFSLIFSNTFRRHDKVTGMKALLEETRGA
ncbi:MAG: hypothetical protein LBD92_07255, partial [Oscillospiraceae bacterium]|nr:hypothetical protein [Oscillospiraceae bacterium]